MTYLRAIKSAGAASTPRERQPQLRVHPAGLHGADVALEVNRPWRAALVGDEAGATAVDAGRDGVNGRAAAQGGVRRADGPAASVDAGAKQRRIATEGSAGQCGRAAVVVNPAARFGRIVI